MGNCSTDINRFNSLTPQGLLFLCDPINSSPKSSWPWEKWKRSSCVPCPWNPPKTGAVSVAKGQSCSSEEHPAAPSGCWCMVRSLTLHWASVLASGTPPGGIRMPPIWATMEGQGEWISQTKLNSPHVLPSACRWKKRGSECDLCSFLLFVPHMQNFRCAEQTLCW